MAHIHDHILPAGTRLGVYEIKKATTVDTFDITYLAWNHHLKEQVEIQEYFPHDFAIRADNGVGVEPKSSGDRDNFNYGLKAFLAQAETLTQIEHPNVIKAENTLHFNGTAYLITACPEGVPLSKLAQAPATIADTELKFILVTILSTLKKVHENNMVHGGIQPATIILGKNGEPLLINFAAARLAIAAHTDKIAGELAPGYAAPELYQHANAPKPASDFYALGATMYYCITHNQPPAAESRKIALNNGETDPLASLSGLQSATYSADLLQAVDWMLRLEDNDRPHSATEILTLLNSGPTNNQAGQTTFQQDSEEVTDSRPAAINPVWIAGMAGIVGLMILGYWLTKKPSEISAYNTDAVTAQPLTQADPGKNTATATIKENQSIDLATTTPANQVPKPDKKTELTKNKINEPEKQPKHIKKEIQLKTSAGDNQPKNNKEAGNTSLSASQTVSRPEQKDKIINKKESNRSQKTALIDNPLQQFKKKKLPTKPNHEGSINGYLAAARKSMKELRFTLPPGNNAHHYYQMVLTKDPGNKEALAGIQKIVDRYAGFIRKSKADGEVARAKRVLKKAESVLPNDPKLQSIRKELADTND